MKLEIRADGAHICGYVNVPEKRSKPVYTQAHGNVIETIAPGAFQRAIDRAHDITLSVDHGKEIFASTAAGTLVVYEDGVGLFADAMVSDAGLIAAAKANKVVGWSFGFSANSATVEPIKGSLHLLRRVTDLELNHVSLIINKSPIYKATSWELRDGCTGSESKSLTEEYKKRAAALQNTDFRRRVEALRN